MGNNGHKTWINGVQLLGDAVILNLSIILAFYIKFRGQLPAHNLNDYLTVLPWITIVALFMFNFYGLYSTSNKNWAEISASLICSLFFITLMFFVISYLAQGFAIPRSIFLISPVIQFFFLGLWRYGMYRLELKILTARKVVIIGELNEAHELAKKLGNGRFYIVGFIITGPLFAESIGDYKILGKVEDTKEILLNVGPDEVYVCGKVDEKVKEIVSSICISYPWSVYIVPNLYEILVAHSKLSQIEDTPIFQIGAPVSPGKLQVKRSIDVVLSLIALIAALPVMLLVTIAIKLDSPGPIFYKQERISEKGRRFQVYKFRTMVDNAEKLTGPVLATEKDPRITRVGRFLRATRIDEIPQIINVLKGEMSIVGPRPERPFFVEKFIKEMPEYNFRHTLKPGITGLAQVAGKYSTTVEDKLRYDLLYSKAVSPLFDLQIMMQTVKVLLLKSKAS